MTAASVSELEVFLHDEPVGRLERLAQARLRFTYRPEWVEAGGRPVSLSLPVRPEPYEHDVGGENRPEYLRRRHLDRLADELEVKPSLVLRRLDLMVTLVRSSQEKARNRLPAEFQNRPIIDRIDAVITERGERLLKARSEEP